MKKYTMLLACLALSGLIYAKADEVDKSAKKHKAPAAKAQLKTKSKGSESKKLMAANSKDKNTVSSLKKPKKFAPRNNKHYIYPRSSSRAKNQNSGVVLSGLSAKGNMLIPFSKDSQKDKHAGIMHVYDHAFHAKQGHVLELMSVIVDMKSKKALTVFKKALDRIHAASDDWGALKEAVTSYDEFACTTVELFAKERLQQREVPLNAKLKRTVRKIIHTQPELMYAAHKVAHSRLLLSEYAQDNRLDQYLKTTEKALKSDKIVRKFNSSKQRVVQTRNRLVALCVLLEGAVVNYCAVKDALVTDIEKQSLSAGKAIEEIIKEIQQTLLV